MLNGNERPEVAQASVTFCACTLYGLISPMGAKRLRREDWSAESHVRGVRSRAVDQDLRVGEITFRKGPSGLIVQDREGVADACDKGVR